MINEEKIIEKVKSVYIKNGIEINCIKHHFDKFVIEFKDRTGGDLYRVRTEISREECQYMPRNIYEDFLMGTIENGVKIIIEHRMEVIGETDYSHIFPL